MTKQHLLQEYLLNPSNSGGDHLLTNKSVLAVGIVGKTRNRLNQWCRILLHKSLTRSRHWQLE